MNKYDDNDFTFFILLIIIGCIVLGYLLNVGMFSLIIYLINLGGTSISYNVWIGGALLTILVLLLNNNK